MVLLYIFKQRGIIMKKYIYILTTCVLAVGFAFTAQFNEPNALSWYGFDSYSTNSQYSMQPQGFREK